MSSTQRLPRLNFPGIVGSADSQGSHARKGLQNYPSDVTTSNYGVFFFSIKNVKWCVNVCVCFSAASLFPIPAVRKCGSDPTKNKENFCFLALSRCAPLRATNHHFPREFRQTVAAELYPSSTNNGQSISLPPAELC